MIKFITKLFSTKGNNKQSINSGDMITELSDGENLVDGKHTFEDAEKEKDNIDYMKKCCDAELKKMKKSGFVASPFYFKRVAILSRKEKNYKQEVEYCEKYISSVEKFYEENGTGGIADVRKGSSYKNIVKRYPKAKALLENHGSN